MNPQPWRWAAKRGVKMEGPKTSDKLFGNLALALLVAGLLVPFIIAMFAKEEIATGFGVVAILLALLFGIIGRKQKTGKVTLLIVGCLGVLVFVLVFGRRAEARSTMQRAIEKQAERNAAPPPSTPQAGNPESAR